MEGRDSDPAFAASGSYSCAPFLQNMSAEVTVIFLTTFVYSMQCTWGVVEPSSQPRNAALSLGELTIIFIT